MISIFRISIVLSIVVYTTFVAKPYFDSSFHSDAILNILSWSGYEALVTLPFWFAWLTILIWLPVSIGMYYFNHIARTIYLILTITFTVTIPLYGAYTFTGTDIMLFQLTAFLDGAILTMAYLTSVSDQFKKS